MSKDPAFLFYPNDWIGGTMGMTLEEKGAYIELLMMQFNRGHMTKHMIGLVVGQLWDKVKDKFEVDDKGLYFNRRLDEESEKRKRFTESRRNNKTGKNQYSNTSNNSGHMTSHMENENENVNKDINESETEILVWPTFEDFWNAYDKKVGLKKVKPKFEKLKQETKELIMDHLFEYVKSTPDKKYRLNPESYLNGKSWDNEIIENDGRKKGFTENLARHFEETDPNWKNL